MRILSLQEAEDILYGACIHGAGGGGSLKEGLALLKAIYERGQQIKLISLDEVEDAWLIVSPYYVGSVAPPTAEAALKLEGLEVMEGNPSVFATLALQKHLKQEIKAICATELGGNTAWAMDVAAQLNLPIIDADPAGRAVPDLAHTTFNVFGASITPFALANRYGDSLVVESVVNHDRADQIARSFASVSGNFSGICDHPLQGDRFKEIVIDKTLTKSEQLGRARREALEQQKSPIQALLTKPNVTLITEGTVIQSDWRDATGFIEGDFVVEPFGHTNEAEHFSIWFRNENMYIKKDEQLISIIPDVITVLDFETGEPILNPTCKVGEKVAIVNISSPEIWTTEQGLEVFGPNYIGMSNEDYNGLKK
ncbi:DUF917 domain-containing protein [Sporosarcina sp. FSL K6-1522]|uniref:DUF917 domain-containing protein n=1 Tax=Sporosarcina sp. FSL K6-1522 TaxID=2921554 RepID=UPI00315AAB13